MSIFKFSLIFILLVFISSYGVFAQKKVKNPGNALIFSDDFKKDSIGSYPKKWQGNARAVIEMKNTGDEKWMKLFSQGTFVPMLEKMLPESYVVEFDYIYVVNGGGNNSVELTFFNRQQGSPLDVDFPGLGGVKIYLGDFLVSYLRYSNTDILDKSAGENRNLVIPQHKLTKIRIVVQKKLVTLQINGGLVLEIPGSKKLLSTLNTFRFNLWGTAAEPLIGNFRINGI